MQYLLLCCFDEERWESLPESLRDEIMREYGAWIQDVKQRGQYLAGIFDIVGNRLLAILLRHPARHHVAAARVEAMEALDAD